MGHRRTPQPPQTTGRAGRLVRGNEQVQTVITHGADAWSMQIASLGHATNTFSPMSAGRHSPGASSRGFVGDRGYGVNRWAGRASVFAGNVQQVGAASAPIAKPRSNRLGANAMASGQPGYPSTGANGGGLGDLVGLGYSQINSAGWAW